MDSLNILLWILWILIISISFDEYHNYQKENNDAECRTELDSLNSKLLNNTITEKEYQIEANNINFKLNSK